MPKTLTWNISTTCWGWFSEKAWKSPYPALLKRMSIRPKASSVAAINASIAWGWDISVTWTRTSVPHCSSSSWARACKRSWRLAANTNLQPSWANWWATACPIPLVAPVMITTCLSKFLDMSYLLLSHQTHQSHRPVSLLQKYGALGLLIAWRLFPYSGR